VYARSRSDQYPKRQHYSLQIILLLHSRGMSFIHSKQKEISHDTREQRPLSTVQCSRPCAIITMSSQPTFRPHLVRVHDSGESRRTLIPSMTVRNAENEQHTQVPYMLRGQKTLNTENINPSEKRKHHTYPTVLSYLPGRLIAV